VTKVEIINLFYHFMAEGFILLNVKDTNFWKN